MKNLFIRSVSSKQTALAALLLLPLSAAIILRAVYPHRATSPSPHPIGPSELHLAEFYAPAPLPVPDLHHPPLGGLTLRDIQMGPISLVALPGFAAPLEAIVDADLLTITDNESRTTVWSGPVSQAGFLIRTRTGVHMLFDLHGKELWNETSVLSSPDLLLQEKPDGNASLIGKKGNVIWTARINPQTAQKDMSAADPSLHVPGIRLKIGNKAFQLTDDTGRLFLSGTLPLHPTVLAKYATQTQYASPSRCGTDLDRDDQVRFESVTGSAIIADSDAKALGVLPVKEVAVLATTHYASSPLNGQMKTPADLRWPKLYRVPSAMLNVIGTVTLTYHNPSGDVFREIQVRRDHHYCLTT